jgi:hypothetical protein
MPSNEELLQGNLLPADLTDDQFIAAMEQLRIANSDFHHRDHIRLAWAYLSTFSAPLAEAKLAHCIRQFAAHQNAPHKYHHTITLVWTRVVAAAMCLTPALSSLEQFVAEHPFLLNARLPWTFYSATRLGSEAARTGWVDPDLYPLP